MNSTPLFRFKKGLITHEDKSDDPNYFPFYEEVVGSGFSPYEGFVYLRIARLIYPNHPAVSIADIVERGEISEKTGRRYVKSILRKGIIEAISLPKGYRTFRLVKPSEWQAKAKEFEEASKVPPVRTTKREVSHSLRFHVLKRDGFRCRYCGITAAETKLVIDHVYPFSKGGKCVAENLAAACEECNTGKSDSIL